MSTGRSIPSQAIILVGGEGARLRPVTSRVPKPLAPVVERLADHFQLEVVSVNDSGGDEWWIYSSTWMLLARDRSVLEREAIAEASDPCGKGSGCELWTDDFASVWSILMP